MAQKYGFRANELQQPEWSCAVCGENAGFNWSDYHGEGMCNRCGTPYQLTEEGQPCTLKSEWIEVAKEYWNETKAYMGLGTIMMWRDYPECKEGREKFFDWVKRKKPELMEAA